MANFRLCMNARGLSDTTNSFRYVQVASDRSRPPTTHHSLLDMNFAFACAGGCSLVLYFICDAPQHGNAQF